MDEENKKINLESFFKRVNSVEQIANSALSRANSNLGINNNQKSLIESLSISIEAMQTKIRDIANYIIVEKKLEADREEDRRLEAEDAEQKRQMTERAAAMGETGPQKESVKPAEPQGGGSFLGGLIKTLGTLMVGGFALKYIAPVILPKLLLLAKSKLLPLIGAGLKTAVTTSFKFIGGALSKGFLPLVGLTLIGKAFKPIVEGIKGTFDGVSNFFAGKIDSIFKGGGGDGGTGVSSNSNMGATNSTVENDMVNTLTEEGLIENKEEDGSEEEINEKIEEGGGKEEINEKIEEGGGESSSGNLSMFNEDQKNDGGKKEINEKIEEGGKKEINEETETDASEVRSDSDMMSGRGKFVNPQLEKTKTNQDGGDNDERIKLKEGKITVEENSKEGGYTETFPNEGGKSEFSFSESADGSESNIKKSYEGTINRFDMDTGKAYILGTEVTADGYNEMLALPDADRTNIEKLKPIVEEHRVDKLKVEVQKKNDLDLSLRQNLETTDKVVNAVTYESGIDNRDQNSSVLVQSKPAQTTIASIKKTSSPVAFIKSNKNKFLSINETELPPEVARMIT